MIQGFRILEYYLIMIFNWIGFACLVNYTHSIDSEVYMGLYGKCTKIPLKPLSENKLLDTAVFLIFWKVSKSDNFLCVFVQLKCAIHCGREATIKRIMSSLNYKHW